MAAAETSGIRVIIYGNLERKHCLERPVISVRTYIPEAKIMVWCAYEDNNSYARLGRAYLQREEKTSKFNFSERTFAPHTYPPVGYSPYEHIKKYDKDYNKDEYLVLLDFNHSYLIGESPSWKTKEPCIGLSMVELTEDYVPGRKYITKYGEDVTSRDYIKNTLYGVGISCN